MKDFHCKTFLLRPIFLLMLSGAELAVAKLPEERKLPVAMETPSFVGPRHRPIVRLRGSSIPRGKALRAGVGLSLTVLYVP
jgi:hypothetical protein